MHRARFVGRALDNRRIEALIDRVFRRGEYLALKASTSRSFDESDRAIDGLVVLTGRLVKIKKWFRANTPKKKRRA